MKKEIETLDQLYASFNMAKSAKERTRITEMIQALIKANPGLYQAWRNS
jgi:hypothetical protein